MNLGCPNIYMPCPYCGGDLLGGLLWTEDDSGTIEEVWVEDGQACCDTGYLDLLEGGLESYLLFDPTMKSFDDVARYRLRLEAVTRKQAQAFIREHHRHNPPPPGDKYRVACFNGDHLVGVAMAGRPVARNIDASQVLEVNRCCVHPDLNWQLVEHACSMLYGACYRFAKDNGYHQLLTYTLQEEPGTSLIAAGFKLAGTTKGGSWNSPSRPRVDKAPTGPKNRWIWNIPGKRRKREAA